MTSESAPSPVPLSPGNERTAICWSCGRHLCHYHYIGICHVKANVPGESGEKHAWRCPKPCNAITFADLTHEEFQAQRDRWLTKYRARKAAKEARP